MSKNPQAPHANLVLYRGEIKQDAWSLLADDQTVPAEGDVFVSLERFLADPSLLSERLGRGGVRLEPHHTAQDLAALFDAERLAAKLDAIAVNFPKFTDGRGYTLARRLREQHGWAGALRAIGDVLPDQCFYLQRCGFDTLALREGKSLKTARQALSSFSVAYQGASDDARPLYRRRPRLESARAS